MVDRRNEQSTHCSLAFDAEERLFAESRDVPSFGIAGLTNDMRACLGMNDRILVEGATGDVGARLPADDPLTRRRARQRRPECPPADPLMVASPRTYIIVAERSAVGPRGVGRRA